MFKLFVLGRLFVKNRAGSSFLVWVLAVGGYCRCTDRDLRFGGVGFVKVILVEKG